MRYLWLISWVLLSLPLPLGAESAEQKLATEKGCLACHGIEMKIACPAYKDIAQKYTKQDEDKLVHSVLNGSMGKWGPIPMPPQRGIVTEEEARKLVRWILSLK